MRNAFCLLLLAALTDCSGCRAQPLGGKCSGTSDCTSGLVCLDATCQRCPLQMCAGDLTGINPDGPSGSTGTMGMVLPTGPSGPSGASGPSNSGPLPSYSANDLVIVEVATQPTRTQAAFGADGISNNLGQLEFVELFNRSSSSVDLSGLSLTITLSAQQGANGPSGTFATTQTHPLSGTAIAGERIVVARNATVVSTLYPAAHVVSAPGLRLDSFWPNTSKHPHHLKYKKLTVSLLGNTQSQNPGLVVDVSRDFGVHLHNYFLPDNFYTSTLASLAARKAAWTAYEFGGSNKNLMGHADRHVGNKKLVVSAPSAWGTPGAANTLGNVDSPLKNALQIKEFGEGGGNRAGFAPNSCFNMAPGHCSNGATCAPAPTGPFCGAGTTGDCYSSGVQNLECIENSFSHVELKNVSSNPVDVLGMTLEMWRDQSTHPHHYVIGLTPVSPALNGKTTAASANDILSLALLPTQSVVLTRNPDLFKVAIDNRTESGVAVFGAVTNVVDGHGSSVPHLYKVASSIAASHGGFIVPADIPHASSTSGNRPSYTGHGAYFVVRDRQGLIVTTGASGASGFIGQRLWVTAPTGPNANAPTGYKVSGRTAYPSGSTSNARCGVTKNAANTTFDGACWYTGFTMEDAP